MGLDGSVEVNVPLGTYRNADCHDCASKGGNYSLEPQDSTQPWLSVAVSG